MNNIAMTPKGQRSVSANNLEADVTLVTVKDVVRDMGLAERTIRRWMADGRLPYVRIGGGKRPPVRIKKRDVLALMRPGRGYNNPSRSRSRHELPR